MGMSTHIVGYRPVDARWERMKAAYEACEAADVEIPEDVLAFFSNEPPGDKPGLEVSIEDSPGVSEYSGDSLSGFEIDIRQLPADICIIRFYNAW